MQPSTAKPATSLLFVLIWIILIILVARYGRKRKLGLGWTLVISIILSPILGFIIAAASGKKEVLIR